MQPESQRKPYFAYETAISYVMDMPRVFKCVAQDGDITAKKVDFQSALLDSEVRMLDHATRTCQVKVQNFGAPT